jgi:hypothetical protein
MPVKLIKQLTKTSDQDWSGIWFKEFESSMSSSPDSRDGQPNYDDTQARTLKNHIRDNIKSAPGYIGWAREYVNDDVVRLIWHFGNKETAYGYLMGRSIRDANTFNSYKNVIRSKKNDYNYTGQWIIVDENGSEENVPMT